MSVCLRLIMILAVGLATANAAEPPPSSAPLVGPGSLSGVWLSGRGWQTGAQQGNLGSLRTPERDRVRRTVEGKWPEMLPWAAELLEQRIALSQRGEPPELTLTRCLPGMPALMFGGPYPIQILETPGQVTILFEEQNHFRVIYLDEQHPEEPDPTYWGHSVGHWQGDTLVVDTIGLRENTPVDRVGMPHSEALHLIERFRRIDNNTLEVVTTVDDPKAFAKPWDTRVTFSVTPPGIGISEYICENNRDL